VYLDNASFFRATLLQMCFSSILRSIAKKTKPKKYEKKNNNNKKRKEKEVVNFGGLLTLASTTIHKTIIWMPCASTLLTTKSHMVMQLPSPMSFYVNTKGSIKLNTIPLSMHSFI
jgi:UDP-N-acetylmuramyl pentapeptide phosphotransferase/UDP-N-acetylglucosamine-1-phosphate transferase